MTTNWYLVIALCILGMEGKNRHCKVWNFSVEDRHELPVTCLPGLTSSRQEAVMASPHFQMRGKCVWSDPMDNFELHKYLYSEEGETKRSLKFGQIIQLSSRGLLLSTGVLLAEPTLNL